MKYLFQKLDKHHNWNGGRVLNVGYPFIKADGHPRANRAGYVQEHILIAENVFGGPLPQNAVVHHVNNDREDNRKENLVICENESYHRILHQRTKSFNKTGHGGFRKCWICKEYGDPAQMRIETNKNRVHAECKRKYAMKRYHARQALKSEVE